jgi:UDP-N-acetylmuramoyl-L-alanyl-D-glutamate--2,6-diaminopimelate ligase
VRFAAGGFTNFGLDHLDFHSDLDDYFAAKAKLFDGRCAVEIVNIADPAGRRLVKPGTITYAPPGGPPTDWFATEVVQDGYRQRFVAHGPDGLEIASGVGLPGRHNVANALLALALLTACGVDPKLAGSAIAECPGAPGRMERVSSGGAVVGIVDYAHKPDSITEVLGALERRPGKRIICVIGAGGDRDQGKRQLMGAAAARGSDIVIVTDDNPRGEDPAAIRAMVLEGARAAALESARAAALESAGTVALESAGTVALESASGAAAGDGGMSGGTILEIAGRGLAITRAVELAEPGDVIALLGKGHETGQKIGDIVHPFDDRIELAQAMAVKERATVAKEADS